MIRTQIYIPDDLFYEAKLIANSHRINFSQLVRDGLTDVIKKKRNIGRNKKTWGEGFIGAGTKGLGPKNLSSKIDYYLYGEGNSKWGKK